MPEQQPAVVKGRTFEPPGKGPWELERTHFSRPVTAFAQNAVHGGVREGIRGGDREATVCCSTTCEPGFSRPSSTPSRWRSGARQEPWVRPQADAPAPDPAAPGDAEADRAGRRRRSRSKLWREDLARWDEVDKPAAIEAHRAVQAVDVAAMSDEELAQHLDRCAEHVADSIYLHHKYTIAACLPVGDFLAGATAWTGADERRAARPAPRALGDLAGLRGGRAGGRRRRRSPPPTRPRDPGRSVEGRREAGGARSRPGRRARRVGVSGRRPLAQRRVRRRGRDGRGDARHAGRGARGRWWAAVRGSQDEDTGLAAIRELVAEEHREDFDDRLGEVRLMYRLRDERGVYSDGWATGLARRALLETGRRLSTSGRLRVRSTPCN